MKLKELKEWVNNLPEECMEYDIVNAEVGTLNEEEEITYRFDKPVSVLVVDDDNKEIVLLNDKIGE